MLTTIFEYINNYGFMTAFAGMTLYFLYKYFNKQLSYKKPSNLRFHQIFSNIDVWLTSRINNLNIECPLRSAIFKDFLKIKFRHAQNKLLQLITIPNINNVDNTELENILLQSLNNIVLEYELEARVMGIPEIVIQRFNYWHDGRVQMLKQTIGHVSHSTFLLNNLEKVSVVLDTFNTVLSMTLIDAEKTLIDLNGQIDDVNYNGIVCQHCPVCRKKIKQY